MYEKREPNLRRYNDAYEERGASRPMALSAERRAQKIGGIVFRMLAIGLLTGCDSHIQRQQDVWCNSNSVPAQATGRGLDLRWNVPPEFVELWSVGTVLQQNGPVAPTAIATYRTTGTVAVADHSQNAVAFISSDGRLIGRSPDRSTPAGTLVIPAAIQWTDEGLLEVLDNVRWRLFFLRPDGTLVREESLDGDALRQLRLEDISLQHPNILGQTHTQTAAQRDSGVLTVHLIQARHFGKEIDTIASTKVSATVANDPRTASNSDSIPSTFAYDGSNLVLAGDVSGARVRVLDSIGRFVREFCHEPVANPDAPQPRASTIADSLAATALRVGRVFVGADSVIWLQRTVGNRALLLDRWFGAEGGTFDLFTNRGEYLGEVRAPRNLRLATAYGDTVIGLRTLKTGEIAVVAFRLQNARK